MSHSRHLPPWGVSRPIPDQLLRLALPILASQALRVSYQWVDALWVRGLGVEATAAVTTSIFVMWWVYSLNDIVSVGVSAYVSQLLGSGDRARAGVAALKGLRGSLLLGLVGTALGLTLPRYICGLMGEQGKVLELGVAYLRVVLIAAPLPMMYLTCESIMRSSGDTRTPLLLDLCSVALNAVLAPMMIYGWGPFPRLGIAGAAWSTVWAQALLVACYLALAARRHPAFPLARRAPGDPVRILGMARVGIPASVIGMLFSVVYIAFTRAASVFGAAAIAVVGIVNRVESLEYMVAVAIGSAGAVLVGQNLGARQVERATQALVIGLRWGIVIAGILMVPMLAFPEFFIRLFSHDPEVVRLGIPYLRVVASCALFNTAELIVAQGIMGSGHTTAISVIFTSISLLRIPLTFLVPRWFHTGVVGIAWVIMSTCVVRSVIILGWASRGTWKTGLDMASQGAPPVVPETPEGI